MEAVRRDGSSKAAWIELSNMFYKSRGDKCQCLNKNIGSLTRQSNLKEKNALFRKEHSHN